MPIIIRRQDMNGGMAQSFDSAIVTEDVMLASWVSYAALGMAYKELYGSI